MPSENYSPEGIKGLIPYDLAPEVCEECGRPKLNRLWFDGLGVQDCATCTEVATRHRCVKRPDIGSLADGESWACPDCWSTWTRKSREESCACPCGEAIHTVIVPDWEFTEGDRMDAAPRYYRAAYTPFRNRIPKRESGKPFPGLPY